MISSQNNISYSSLYRPKSSVEIFTDDLDKLNCYAMKNNTDVASIINKMITLYEQQDRNATDLYKFYTAEVRNY